MIGWPQALLSSWASPRPVTSVTPPGAAVTMKVMGRCGYGPVCAAATAHSRGTSVNAPNHRIMACPLQSDFAEVDARAEFGFQRLGAATGEDLQRIGAGILVEAVEFE